MSPENTVSICYVRRRKKKYKTKKYFENRSL